jgi:hypothetical protein
MKKLLSLSILIVALFGISTQSSAYVNYAENYAGNYVYTTTCSYRPTSKIPITSTQALHTKGYTTTISISTSTTKSLAATGSITSGVSYFVETTVTCGLTQTESCTVSAGVAYTIGSSISTGWYRISTYFPSRQIINRRYNEITGVLITTYPTITNAPNDDDSYYGLENYAS